MALARCSDEVLLTSVEKLLGAHRVLTAKLVAHLAEIEERRLHLLAGYSSMFDSCQKKLGMSAGEAFRRILAARLTRRFPIVYSLLASGDVNLSTLELLREHLTGENHEELLTLVTRRSKLEVQTLLATRFPRLNAPPTTRRLASTEPLSEGWFNAPPTIRRLASTEPLSEGWFKVEFTASDALRRKLELCRDLMSHANPSRDLAIVIERAARHTASRTPRAARSTNATACVAPMSPKTVAAARCAFLELDHVHAKSPGGLERARKSSRSLPSS